jgi:hypothetical protein
VLQGLAGCICSLSFNIPFTDLCARPQLENPRHMAKFSARPAFRWKSLLPDSKCHDIESNVFELNLHYMCHEYIISNFRAGPTPFPRFLLDSCENSTQVVASSQQQHKQRVCQSFPLSSTNAPSLSHRGYAILVDGCLVCPCPRWNDYA